MMKAYSRRKFLQVSTLFAVAEVPYNAFAGKESVSDIGKLLQREEPVTWVFTGDSVTQGALHTYRKRCYSELFSEHVRWNMKRYNDIVINSGVNGTTSSYLKDTFEWFTSRFRPDVVFIMYGINDCAAKGLSIEAFGSNINLLVERIRAIGAIPILQTPNGIDFLGTEKMKTASRCLLPEYVAKLRAIAKEKEVIIIDHYTYWNKKGIRIFKDWLDDPFHPGTKGHDQIAQLILKELKIIDSK